MPQFAVMYFTHTNDKVPENAETRIKSFLLT